MGTFTTMECVSVYRTTTYLLQGRPLALPYNHGPAGYPQTRFSPWEYHRLALKAGLMTSYHSYQLYADVCGYV